MKVIKKSALLNFLKIKYNLLLWKLKLVVPKYKLRREVKTFKPIILNNNESDVVIAIFCGKSEYIEAITCLYSFYLFSNYKYPLYWFNDGSLSNTDLKFIKSRLVNVTIIQSERINENISNWLLSNNLSTLKLLRDTLIFGRRLVDINYHLSGKTVLQLDSDVLFLNKPDLLLKHMDIAHAKNSFTWFYNKDICNSYCTSPESIQKDLDIPLVENFNAGLVLFKADKKNLQYLERVNLNVERIYFWEQTLFAILVSKFNGMELPPVYDVHFKNFGKDSSKVLSVASRHYCSDSRPFFYEHFNSYLLSKMP